MNVTKVGGRDGRGAGGGCSGTELMSFTSWLRGQRCNSVSGFVVPKVFRFDKLATDHCINLGGKVCHDDFFAGVRKITQAGIFARLEPRGALGPTSFDTRLFTPFATASLRYAGSGAPLL